MTDAAMLMRDAPTTLEPGEEYAFPATVGQEAFWYLDRLRPGNPAYNISIRFRVTGPLRPAVLQRALAEVVRRHEALRTTFATNDGELVQRVAPPGSILLPIDDLRGQTDPQRAEALMAVEASRAFDLETGPLFRARLLRLADAEYALLLTVHHIVADGWSTGLIIDELAALYAAFAAGRASPLPEPALQYGDFAVWQTEALRAPAVVAQLDYWKKQLAALEPLSIPHDRETAAGAPVRGRIESILLPRQLTDRLTELSRQHGVTLFPTCLACLELLLRLRTSRDDVAVGTLVAGRSRTELESVVGLFVNTLVLRTDLSGDPTFLELLARVRRTVTEAMDNQDIPFGRVVEAGSVRRQKGRHPLFGVNFLFQTAFLKPAQAGDVTITPVPSLSPGVVLDLNLFMVERQEGWRVSCEYNPDEYEPETVGRLLHDFHEILEAASAHPDRPISSLRPLPKAITPGVPGDPAARNGRSPGLQAPASENETAAGSTPPASDEDTLESRLARVWREVLRVERIGASEDFFDLGGHSLMAARLVAKVQDQFGIRLSPATVFEHPTIRQMARVLEGAAGSRSSKTGNVSRNAITAPSSPAQVSPVNPQQRSDGVRTTPFFFQSADGPLYGVHTPPVGQDRGAAVVLCAPPGHEYMTTHWCLRLLAADLARAGFHVLRFDYSCLGNSWGAFEQASLAQWVRDVGVAVQELADRCGAPVVSLVGLRLGAALAYLAACESRVDHLVLWDPVADGRRYLAQLRQMHARIHPGGCSIQESVEELLGYGYPAGLVTELERLDLTTADPLCGRISLLLSDGSTDPASLRTQLSTRGPAPSIRAVGEPAAWENADTFDNPILLHAARRAVIDRLSEPTP